MTARPKNASLRAVYALKKLISAFLLPMPFALCLIVVGSLLIWRKKRARLGRLAVGLALTIVAASSCDPISCVLVSPLEDSHPPLPADVTATVEASLGKQSTYWVVVLGGGLRNIPAASAATQLSPGSLGRVIEGVRVWHALPGAKILLSGGGRPPMAEVAAEAARSLGVPDASVVTETRPIDTAEEAALIRERIGAVPIILVTSASHMPRAVALFRKQGFVVLPAPTDYTHGAGFSVADLFPSAWAVHTSEVAIHEYLGYLAAWLMGRV